jgi:small-conductance mechanosensitive channel
MRKLQPIAFVVFLLMMPIALQAQESTPEARVEIGGRTLFVLHSGVGSFTAEERAQAVNQRLRMILESPLTRIEVGVERGDMGLQVVNAGRPVIAVTEADAQAEKVSADLLANRWSATIQEALSAARAERFRQTLWRRLLITAAVLAGAFLAFLMFYRGRKRLLAWAESRRGRVPELHFRGLVLLSAEQLYRGIVRGVWLVYVGAQIVVAGSTLLLVFEQVPATQSYARQVFMWIWTPLGKIFWGVVGYLPNLFYILVIIAVTRLVIRGLSFIFAQAERGVISLEPWIHRDVARPTSLILRAVLIVLALFFIAPLIPGTGTTAAQGITVLLGLMISFGSTSTVGNIIAGVVLTYMRPFQIGERVKIGETTGDVVDKTFLYTKILTIKNEEVTVPSLQVLSNAMVNYSAKAQRTGLILHTSVTIGYDAPWRKVHELLLRAADRTSGVLKDPKPFVLQTSLDDFFVSYQLNAYTDRPNQMQTIYSELHQNIQDSFNEGGVEIMSPHHYQLRDGNTTTIPSTYRETGYQPARFLVEALVGEQRGGGSR